jgi:hypothetical protein
MPGPDLDARSRALAEIVTIARTHRLSVAEIGAAVGEAAAVAPAPRARGVLVRVLGILGGSFVFAGVCAFIALQWDAMNSASRVIVTLGPGIVALVLGVLAARDPRLDRATIPLLLAAAILQPTGMLVAFEEFGTGGDWRLASLTVSAVMAIQFGTLFGSLRRSTTLLIAVLFAAMFWWTAFDLLDWDDAAVGLVLGAMLLLAAVGAAKIGHADITPLIYFFGAVMFLYGFFDVVEDSAVEVLFVAVAAGFIYLSVILHSRTLLVVATLAILAYTGYFTSEHFADSIGWPLSLIAFGLFMIGLSAMAVRIDRDYVRQPPVAGSP